MPYLDGRTAVITGSSRGIGRAIALELARRGAMLVINYIEHEEKAAQTKAEAERMGVRAEVVRANVASPDEARKMTALALDQFGSIDILVNNAGIVRDKTLWEMSDDQWHDVVNVDLHGVYYCSREVVPYMRERGYGRIVNIASIVGQTGAFGQTNYAAAKAGVIGFTKAAALELARYGITVNAVCPGYVDTDMLAAVPEAIREQIKARIPLKRFAQPDEIARVVRFLVEEGDYIAGQCINVNGGLFMA